MAFERSFKPDAIKSLKKERLFGKCLLPDIRNGVVFPAVRKDRMDFYYMGGKLFSYSMRNGFLTHHKYASVIRSNRNRPYVSDDNLKAIHGFVEGYERIKENCALYSGVEARGVSQVYRDCSCARLDSSTSVLVLDIEISLRKNGEAVEAEPGTVPKAGRDQIDLLLFNKETRLLRFFEAKDFSNREIRSIETKAPKLEKQMQRYMKQLENHDVLRDLLGGYQTHVRVINQLFQPRPRLPEPEAIDSMPRILVFGFDRPQYTGKLKSEVERLETKYNLFVYAIGDIKRAEPSPLFNGGRKRWAPVLL